MSHVTRLMRKACLCRFNVYHAVHSTSMLPLKKICLLLHDDSKAIFCSASPDAFQEDGGPLDKTDNEHVGSILEHRQMCVAMSSGDVFVSCCSSLHPAHRRLPQLASWLRSSASKQTSHGWLACLHQRRGPCILLVSFERLMLKG